MCILPDDLKSFFLTTNGLLIQCSIKFDGDNESTTITLFKFIQFSKWNLSVHRIAEDGWSVINNSYRAIFVSPWKMVSVMDGKDQNMDSLFSCQRKPLYGEGIVWLANHVAVWRQSKVSIDFKKVLGHEVFSRERSLTQPKLSHTRFYLFDKPIKSLYLHSFVVSVLFMHFHFRVIRNCSVVLCFQGVSYHLGRWNLIL